MAISKIQVFLVVVYPSLSFCEPRLYFQVIRITIDSMPGTKKLTQKDVAKLAGVSQAIVSHVVNNTSKVIPEQTRQRVITAMDELGYTPNKAARSLRAQKSFAIACIVPDITNAFFPAFLRGIQSVADFHDYDLIIYDSNTSAAKELHYARALGSGHVDGAVAVLFNRDDEVVTDLIAQGIHIVSFEGTRPKPGTRQHDVVYIDNISAAQAAVAYLIKHGHTRIGMLTGTEGTPPQRRRLQGYRQTLSKHNLCFDETLVRNGNYTEKTGFAEMVALLSLPEKPTAVFAANDLMAIGAMFAVQNAGLRVPEDIAIIGFDDIPAASLVRPRLTTVRQFQEKTGQQSAELLFSRLSGDVTDQVQFIEMPFEIVEREST
jgi:LacI family transcriptional regulator